MNLLQNGVNFSYDESNMKISSNTMDKWILSVAQSLVQFVHKEMEGNYKDFVLFCLNNIHSSILDKWTTSLWCLIF